MTIRASLVVALFLAVPVRDAEAAPIPETALSQSLQARSELLFQNEASQYLFPQLGAGRPSAIFAFGASSEQRVQGSGVRAAFDGSGFSFLTLRSVPFATSSRRSGPVYQVGWAGRTGGLRVGGAYEWSILGARLRRVETGDEIDRALSEFLTLAHHQASLGLGWGDDVASVDLVAELRWERFDYKFHEVDTRTAPYYRRLEEAKTKVEGDVMPGVAIRARAPLGPELRLVGFGSFRQASFDVSKYALYDITSLGDIAVYESDETFRDTGKSWSAGAFLETGVRWRLALHGFWEATHEPVRIAPSGADQARTTTETNSLRIGASAAHELAQATTLHAGWSMTDRRDVVMRTEEDPIPGTAVFEEQRRSVFHEFGWGATHTFWFLDLTGSVAHDLSLGNLFLLLDLRARF